ncbi:MAG: GntR family transcriptional regulator [Pseudomonadota bacterium]
MSDSPTLTPGRPRHAQLSDWLRDRLTSGHYAPHDQLPSESELGDLAGVSRITVRRALSTLENEGLIYRRQGLGSFAAPPAIPQGLVRLTDFAQDMHRAGLAATSRVVHHAAEPAPPAAAAALELKGGATVIRLDRVRLGDGETVAIDRTWLPPFYAQFLEGRDLAAETIYQILEREHEIPVERARYRIEATLASANDAPLLGVPEGAPLLLVERLSYTAADKPVYYQRRYYRADRVSFDLELARSGAGGPSRSAPGTGGESTWVPLK